MAREVGKRRSQETTDWKDSTKEAYNLKITITERQFGRINGAAIQKAEASVARTFRDKLAPKVGCCSVIALAMFAFSMFLLFYQSAPQFSPYWKFHLFSLFGSFLAASVLGVTCWNLKQPRLRAVGVLADKLLREGLKQFEAEQLEYLKFYMTPEWRSLRAQTIKRKGKTCNRCGIRIQAAKDVTVDHILPRSVHPERALDPTNLQVLCRSCNSAKGARVKSESDEEI